MIHSMLWVNSHDKYVYSYSTGIYFRRQSKVDPRAVRFIWISMLWVNGHDKYFYSYSARIYLRRQNLPSTGVIFWRLQLIPAL